MARTKRKINPLAPTVQETVQERIYNVGGYARLSVEDGGKVDADTIQAQKELIESFIAAQPDMRLCGLYCDNGRTGTNFQRPEFERLMEDVRGGKIDCIVVKDLSRFGRNYLETGNYLERIFPFLDVRFIAVNDNFDTLTAERSQDGYIVPLKNIINEAYSRDISRKSSSAKRIKQQRGEFIGSWAPYGYRKCADDKHKIEPDPVTVPVVRLIFIWRLEGLSYQKIARALNEKGIPSPGKYHCQVGDTCAEEYANSVWSVEKIKKILGNEVYLGHMVQGRKKSGLCQGQKQQLVQKSDWVIVKNTHEPLIDEDTFRAVQVMSEQARKTYKENLGIHDHLGSTPNILRGLIFCADCKRPLVRYKNVTNKGTNLYYTYICQTHSNDPAACPKKNFHETQLKATLWAALRHEIMLADNMQKLVEEYQRSRVAVTQKESLDRQIVSARQNLARSKSLYDSLYQHYVDGLMDEREYVELKQGYRADMEQAQVRIEALEHQKVQQKRQTVDNPWLKNFGAFSKEDGLTDELAHALIERVEIDSENHIEIKLRYRDEYLALKELLDAVGKAVPA